MYKEEAALYQLIKEFDEICRTVGVRYWLIEHELLCAVREERDYSCEVDVSMLYEDFMKFSELANHEEREIECINNNSDMPGVYFRYVNKGTLMYNLLYHKVRKCHGLAVNIHILRRKCREEERLEAIERELEKGIEVIDRVPEIEAEEGELKKTIFFKRNLNALLKKAALTNTDEISILKLPGKSSIQFPEKFWEASDDIRLQSIKVQAPKRKEEYCRLRYGEMWQEIPLKNKKNSYQVVTDTEIPYEKFIKKLEASQEIDELFWKRWRSYNRENEMDFKKQVIEQEAGWDVLFLTEMKYTLWKKYVPVKQRLIELYEEQRYDELALIFADYDDAIHQYVNLGYTIYFDEDIWNIYLELLKLNGKWEFAGQLQSLHQDNNDSELDNEYTRAYLASENAVKLEMVER